MSQGQVNVQGTFRLVSIRYFQPLNLFQVWQKKASISIFASEFKMPELPEKDSGMEPE